MALLNEIQAETPKILQYQKLADEKKHLHGTDEDVPVPKVSIYKGGTVFSEQLVKELITRNYQK